MTRNVVGIVAVGVMLAAGGCDAVGGKADATTHDTVAPDGGGCTPACAGRECGDDGCGGFCGTCGTGTQCNSASGACETCTPECAGATCGADGCGGTCGTCPVGETCNPLKRQCIATCPADCEGKECGEDGCGGVCGTCPDGEECTGGTCTSASKDVIEPVDPGHLADSLDTGLDPGPGGDADQREVVHADAAADIGPQDTGTQDPGAQDPGTQDPGVHDPGVRDPGVYDPGVQDPGPWDPGSHDPGTQDHGAWDPGAQDPGITDPGKDSAVGGCDPCGMGTIAGKTCAPNIQTAIPFVKVWLDTIDCNGNPVHLQTYSNAAGEYRLEVPCGTQTINMLKGSFHGSYTRWIDKGMVTTMTSADGCFPGTAAKIAVVTGDWDAIEETLLLLRLHFKKISGGGAGSSVDEDRENPVAIAFLSGAELLDYDVLFLNCTAAGWPNMRSEEAPLIRANLRAFVAKGGSIYASDYALPYLSETWPGYILGGEWSAAGHATYPTSIVDHDLAAYLGKDKVNITYGLGPLTCVSGIGPDTHLFVDSTTPIDGCAGTQMMASFEPETGGGRVIYTTFHNEEQPKAGGDLQTILEYAVFLM